MGWKDDQVVQGWQSDPVVKPAPEVDNTTMPKELLNEPGLQDVSVDDASLVAGIPGLVKGGAALLAKGASKMLPSVGKYASKIATDTAIKQAEGSRGQITQLAPEIRKKIANYMYEHGYMKPTTGSIGVQEGVTAANDAAGAATGAARKTAAARGAKVDVEGLKKELAEQLGPQYASGVRAGQAGQLQNAIDEVGKLGASADPSRVARTASFLNREAAGQKLYQPTSAMSDVANRTSAANNAAIEKVLSPAEQAAYAAAREEYGITQPLGKMLARGDVKDMTSRGGIGLYSDLKNKVMDTVGNKALGSAAHFVADPKIKAGKSEAAALAAYLKKKYEE